MHRQSDLKRAAELIGKAEALVITAGAGMGVDSGLPDFRGDQGLWRAYPALESRGMSFVDIASPGNFARDPELAWGFYGHRLEMYRRIVPHKGFEILRRWGEGKRGGAFVVTSNVDGQFQKAGFTADCVSEIHGSIHRLQCTQCRAGIWEAAEFVPRVDETACQLINEPPVCRECGALARPNILMFNDWRWDSDVSDEQEARFDAWLDEHRHHAVVIEMGAGTDLPSIRRRGELIGVPVIRINPREWAVGRAFDVGLQGKALETLEALDAIFAGS